MKLSKKALTAIIAVSIAVIALPAGAVVFDEISQFASEISLDITETAAYTSTSEYNKIGDTYNPIDNQDYIVQLLDTDDNSVADAAAIVGFTEEGISYEIPATVKDPSGSLDLSVIALLSTNTEACMTNASSIQTLDTSKATNLTEIGENAFRNCTSLSSISSDSLKSIGENAFYDCTGLETVYLPEVTEIGDYAFSYCENLVPTISTKCDTVGTDAFASVKYVVIEADTEKDLTSYCSEISDSGNLVGLAGVEKVGILNSYGGGISIEITDTSALQALNESAPNTYNGVFYISVDNYPKYSVDNIYNNISTNALYLKYVEEGSYESEVVIVNEGWEDIPVNLTVIVPNYSDNKIYRLSSGSVGEDLKPSPTISPTETQEGSGTYVYTGSVSVLNGGTIVSLTTDVFKTQESEKYPSSFEIVGFNFEGIKNATATIPEELPNASGEMVDVSTLTSLEEGDCIDGANCIGNLILNKAFNLVEIGENAFKGCQFESDIKSRSVSIVGANAFNGCTNLTYVELSNANDVGMCSFEGCTGLKSVNLLSNTTTTIRDSVFNGCKSLKSVSLPSTTTIGNNAFSGCENLETVLLSSSLTEIPNNLFSGLENLITVTDNEKDIENGVTVVNLSGVKTVGTNAFNGCTRLESVSLPSTTTIGDSAFYGCESLKTVLLSSSLTEIPDSLFSGLENLTTVTDDEKNIEDGITGVNLPNVKGVKYCAFMNCTNLKSISLPNATTIGDSVFNGCKSLKSVSLPSTTTIGNNAFSGCENLETVLLSSSLTKIPDSLFSGLKNLTTVTDNEKDIENGATVVNLSGVKTVGINAFNGCTSLKSISLPSTTTIGDSVFKGCTSLKSVSLPNVTELKVNENEVSEIFSDCESLKTVFLSSSLTKIPDSLFSGLKNLTTVTDNETYDEEVTGVDLSGVTTVGTNAFNGCTTLKSISLPSTTTIGDSAFSGCESLKTVLLSSSLNTIPSGCFNGCVRLMTLVDKNVNDLLLNVKSIGEHAFYDCKSFYPTISTTCTYVGGSAFDGIPCVTIHAYNEEALITYCGSIGDNSNLLGLTTVNKIGIHANMPDDIYIDYTPNDVDLDCGYTRYVTAETCEYEKDGCITEIAANIFVKEVSNYGELIQVEDDDVNIKLSIPESQYDSNRTYYLDDGSGNLTEANLTFVEGVYTSDIITTRVLEQGLTLALISVVEVEAVTINGNNNLTYGENENKETYTITTNPQDASYSRIEWSSSNESVLKFEDSSVGQATIVGKGTSEIIATVYQINEEKETSTTTFDVTVNPGDMTGLLTVDNYSGEYDGQEHSITVSGAPKGSTIKYSVDGGNKWTDENPKYIDVCNVQIDCKVENTNYITGTCQGTLSITPTVVVAPSNSPTMIARTDNSITLLKEEDGITQQGDDYTVEYGIDKGDGDIIWQESAEFTKLLSEETYKFYTRYKISDDEKIDNYQNEGYSVASESAEYTTEAKNAPEAPSVGEGIIIDYVTENITIESGYEASYNQDFRDSVKGEVTIKARPGETLYIRIPADKENRVPASKTSINHLPARPEAPAAEDAYSIDYKTEFITVNSGYEASYNQDFSDSVKGEATIKARPGETLYFRNSAGDGVFVGEFASEDLKARPQTPKSPTIDLIGSTTITVTNPVERHEYMLLSINPDGTTNKEGEWTDESVFNNLTSGKTYALITRVKSSDSTFVSENSEVSNYITTNEVLPAPGSVDLEGGEDGSAWSDKETGKDYTNGLFVPMKFRLVGEPVYNVSISFGDMRLTYDSINGWGNSFDSINNHVTVINNSMLSVQSTIVFGLEDPTDQEVAALGFNLVDAAGNGYVSSQKLTAKGTEDSSTTAYLVADITKQPPANRNEKIGTITVEVEGL